MALTTAELLWLRMLLQELHILISIPPTLWCDNVGSIALASNPIFHAQIKHIKVDFHFIWEKPTNKDIQVKYISTFDQAFDIFTKVHIATCFIILRDKLKILPPISLQGDLGETTPSNSDRVMCNSKQIDEDTIMCNSSEDEDKVVCNSKQNGDESISSTQRDVQ
jgi:hypothetical protein